MPSPLVDTKLYVPLVRSATVSRPRLTELLGRGRDARLVLVSAPPGFGKTTAVAAWLADRGVAGQVEGVAWVSLEESERSPASFWTYVLQPWELPSISIFRILLSVVVRAVNLQLLNRNQS